MDLKLRNFKNQKDIIKGSKTFPLRIRNKKPVNTFLQYSCKKMHAPLVKW